MSQKEITIARGDGIGPEIMASTMKILERVCPDLKTHEIEIGRKVYEEGFSSGIRPEAWDLLRKTKVFLKAPITTPQGGGYKSLNVTIRKSLGLYANIRPCLSYAPYVQTHHPKMDLMIVRENEEDLYGGIEHRQTDDVVQCLKLISRPGSEKIIRFAFEYAQRNKRQKVTCLTKDNIMKMTDGLFHEIFREVAKEYPDIKADHMIIDIGTAKVASAPENFDVIVTPNLYGDIVSDVAAEVSGSVGIAGSANLGDQVAMFEAIHGSAPDIAGKGIANPSGLLQGAVMMLLHIGEPGAATQIQNAWLKTLEDGVHTGDIYNKSNSTELANTERFTEALLERLGEKPQKLKAVDYEDRLGSNAHAYPSQIELSPVARAEKSLVGVDVFLDQHDVDPDALASDLQKAQGGLLELRLITNRGVKVWPEGHSETFCTNHWRCRFKRKDEGAPIERKELVQLFDRLEKAGFDVIKTENLYFFNGKQGFSKGQGE
jgi:isocitrate dehydrogenase